MWTGEYEMYEFDLATRSTMPRWRYLIAPRPFMVERGHDDGVGTDEMVAYEYAKVRRSLRRAGPPDRTEIEFFVGGHQIQGQGDVRLPRPSPGLVPLTERDATLSRISHVQRRRATSGRAPGGRGAGGRTADDPRGTAASRLGPGHVRLPGGDIRPRADGLLLGLRAPPGGAGRGPAREQALDITAGTGAVSVPLAVAGARVLAVDISAPMLGALRESRPPERAPGRGARVGA